MSAARITRCRSSKKDPIITMNYLQVKDVSYQYDKEPVLEHVSFRVDSGDFVALTGENGTAKTTLMKLIIGILTPRSGSIVRADQNEAGNPLKLSYLPQQAASFNSGFPSTVYEFVRSGLYRKGSWLKPFTSEDRTRVLENLRSVGMWDLRAQKIGTLSGGQRQRMIIARMLCSDSDLYLLDEPTTGMDSLTRQRFYHLLAEKVQKEHCGILMITHEYDAVSEYANKSLHLSRGTETVSHSDSCEFPEGGHQC